MIHLVRKRFLFPAVVCGLSATFALSGCDTGPADKSSVEQPSPAPATPGIPTAPGVPTPEPGAPTTQPGAPTAQPTAPAPDEKKDADKPADSKPGAPGAGSDTAAPK
jgi:hypothetical protein